MEDTMTADTPPSRRTVLRPDRLAIWLGLALALVALTQVPALHVLPEPWVLPIQTWVGQMLDWLIKDAALFGVKLSEITRSLAWLLSQPFALINAILWEGGELAKVDLPPLSWSVILLATTVAAWRFGGTRLALLAAAALGYCLLFNFWDSAMKTLSSILLVVPICFALGVLLGVAAHSSPRARGAISVYLDFCQTVPIFAYLLPILFFFGFGPLSAMIATLIYAMPPMVRATLLGLETVPSAIRESGLMSGATRRQLMWQILLPSARPTLLLGLNQVIMLSLNAVIIASLIGAGGLGYDVMRALKSLRVGQGLEAGFAIVVIAILIDKLSRAWVTDRLGRTSRPRLAPRMIWAVIGACVLLQLMSFALPILADYPRKLTFSTAKFWDGMLDYVVVHYYDTIESTKNLLLIYVMLPLKKLLLWLPWSFVLLVVTVAGWRARGPLLAASLAAMTAFIVFAGFWDQAMITVYLVGLSVVFALLIGLPLGIWASTNDTVSKVTTVLTDLLQTLPSFVYLIPVVMLFQSGDVPALIAVIAYAMAPVIRYTDAGFRGVRPELVEAATAIGCTRRQILFGVKWYAALPEVLLGVNQTIMLALSMLVITSLVGTTDLGQEVYIGLARTDTGRGFVAGICVAFIAIIADRLLHAWARKQKARMGL